VHFWSTKKIAAELRDNALTPEDRSKYGFAWLAFVFLGTVTSSVSKRDLVGDEFSLVVDVFLVGIGISLCYRANKRGDGKDFWMRLMCLSWTEMIRAALIICAVAYLVGEFVEPVARVRFLLGICWALALLSFFWRIHSFMAWIAHANEPELKG